MYKDELSVQQKWDIVVSKCKEIENSVLGIFKPNSRNKDKRLADFSNKERTLRCDIESGSAKHSLTNELRETRKEIRPRLRQVEEDKVNEKLERLEKTKDDSSRYFLVMRELHSKTKNKPLQIKDKDKLLVIGEK